MFTSLYQSVQISGWIKCISLWCDKWEQVVLVFWPHIFLIWYHLDVGSVCRGVEVIELKIPDELYVYHWMHFVFIIGIHYSLTCCGLVIGIHNISFHSFWHSNATWHHKILLTLMQEIAWHWTRAKVWTKYKFSYKNTFENVVCKMTAILFRPQ